MKGTKLTSSTSLRERASRRLAETRGSEIAEMAMVMPVMFLVFLGIFWVGRSYNIYATVNQAAREGARVAAQSTCATCAGGAGSVVSAVAASLQADHLDPAHIQPPIPLTTPVGCPPGVQGPATTGNIYVWTNVLLTPGASPQECGVVVAFTYPIDLTPIPIMSVLGNVQIQARAQTRVEQ